MATPVVQKYIIKGEDKTRGAFGTVGRSAQKLTKTATALSSSFALFAAKAAAVVAAGYAVKRSLEFVHNTIKKLDDIAKTADKIGLATDALQKLRYTGNILGVETETLDKGFQKFSRTIGEFQLGISFAETYIARFDQGLVDLLKSNADVETKFNQTLQVLDGFGDVTKRNAIAAQLFGRTAKEMTLFTADNVKALSDYAEVQGLIFDEEMLRRAEYYIDKITTKFTWLYTKFGKLAMMAADFFFDTAEEDLAQAEERLKSLQTQLKSLQEMGGESPGVLDKVWNWFLNSTGQTEYLTNEIKELEIAIKAMRASAKGKSLFDDLLLDKALEDAEVAKLAYKMQETTNKIEEQFRKSNKIILDDNEQMIAGLEKSLRDYTKSSKDLFSQWEQAGANAFKSLEDTLVEFTTTAKFNFRSLINSIIADLTRIHIRQSITGPLSQAFTDFLGGVGLGLSGGGTAPWDGTGPDPYPGAVAAGGFVPQGVSGIGQSVRGPSVQIINQASQQLSVDDKTVRYNPKDMVVQIVLEDAERNGPITQALTAPRL